jgi:signal transduction histidine kinase
MDTSPVRQVRPRRLRSRGPVTRYGLAVLVVLAATLLELALQPVLPSTPYLFSYPAVFAVAWLAGRGPGISASLLIAFATFYLFLPPSFSFAVASPKDQLDLGIFVALSVTLALILDRLERAICARDEALAVARETSTRIAEQQALVEAVIEHAPVQLAFCTTDGVFQLQNGSWRAFAGQENTSPLDRVQEFLGRYMLHWNDGRVISAQEWQDLFRRAEERVVEFEAQSRTANSPAWLAGRLAPVRTTVDERLTGIVFVLRDVSAERRFQELREEFVAVITHDLRSPIATISLGLQSALRHRTGRPGDVVQVPSLSLERMYRSAQRLGEMVGELLDASRVELSKLKLDRKEVDLGRFVAELVEDVRPSLRGRAVVTDVPSHPVAASIDPDRLAQVVTNLLDNASKYSRPESTIHVAVREDGGSAELTVKDEGPGIPSADLPRLFDRFFQARGARAQKGGLGLGLYITKGIVDAHGGQLSVDSAQGLGSTFRVALPAVSSAPAHFQQP